MPNRPEHITVDVLAKQIGKKEKYTQSLINKIEKVSKKYFHIYPVHQDSPQGGHPLHAYKLNAGWVVTDPSTACLLLTLHQFTSLTDKFKNNQNAFEQHAIQVCGVSLEVVRNRLEAVRQARYISVSKIGYIQCLPRITFERAYLEMIVKHKESTPLSFLA